jgi:hypothetical protein
VSEFTLSHLPPDQVRGELDEGVRAFDPAVMRGLGPRIHAYASRSKDMDDRVTSEQYEDGYDGTVASVSPELINGC